MPSPINKNTLEHLAKLARIELSAAEKERLAKDLSNILDHFSELQTLDTSLVEPAAGGTHLKNAFREDKPHGKNTGKGKNAFPEHEGGFLKIPPVFE